MLPDLDQAVAPLPVVADVGDAAAQLLFRWGMLGELPRLAARQFEHLAVPDDVRDSQRRQPRLFGAEELPGTAQLHVHLRYVETIIRLHQRTDALLGALVQLFRDQHAIALL